MMTLSALRALLFHARTQPQRLQQQCVVSTHQRAEALPVGGPLQCFVPHILTKVDVVSMMNSLEVRTPIVDVRVAELAATVPENININKNTGGVWSGKLLLKKVMEKYYPKSFIHRQKMGFAVPIGRWFSKQGDLSGYVTERLTNRNAEVLNFFDPAAINDLINKELSGPIWLLLFLEEWLQQNNNKKVQ